MKTNIVLIKFCTKNIFNGIVHTVARECIEMTEKMDRICQARPSFVLTDAVRSCCDTIILLANNFESNFFLTSMLETSHNYATSHIKPNQLRYNKP